MVVQKWVVGTLTIAAVLALFGPAASAQADPAAYAEMEFTVIITDAQDHVGFLDIREVAFGEPGDGTLVARFQVQSFDLNAGTETFHFFMTTPAGSFRAGFDTSGSPATHSSSSAGFDSCAVDGNFVYCVLPYESIEAVVGDALTGTYVITYQQAAQDFAPGGYFESSVLGNRGDDYTITGGSAPAGVPETLDLGGLVEQTVEGAGSAAFVLNITNRGLDNATVNLTIANATDGLSLDLESNTTTIAPNATATLNATVDVPEGTPAGDYAWDVLVMGINGGNATFSLRLTVFEATPAPPEAAPATGNETSGNESSAQDVDEGALGIPGLEAPLVAVGLIVAALTVANRRRRV